MPVRKSQGTTLKTEAPAGTFDVLKQLANRLESQPLVYSLAALLVLMIIAGFSIDVLSRLAWPAVGVFVAGLVAWLAIEWRKLRSGDAARQLDADVSVDVRARDVGERGNVVGIEGLPASREPGKVRVEGERVEGRVAGVRYKPGKPSKDDR